MVVDALEITVCFIINLLTKVLVCLGPHLRKVSYNIENSCYLTMYFFLFFFFKSLNL